MQYLRTVRNRTLILLVIGIVAIAAGCNSKDEKLAPVSGIVTVGGRPIPSGNVTFYPESSKGAAGLHQPNGVIDASGRFELYVPDSKKGAPLGKYKVVVYAVDDPQPGKPNKYFANKKYADIATTTLSIEVVQNPEPGRYDLKLER